METKKTRKHWGYWTKNKCLEEALKYNTKSEFCSNNQSAYNVSWNNDWLNDICTHMKRKTKLLTKEMCHKEALKYQTKTDFRRGDNKEYMTSCENNWIEEICSHMKVLGNRMKRLIYAYEFEDKHVYVGLTYNEINRDSRHKIDKRSMVFKHSKETGLIPELKIHSDYIDVESAKVLEEETVEKYKSTGWIVLNKAKTGGIGGNIKKWTKEKCTQEALKYKTKKDLRKHSNSAYSRAKKSKWINEICTHMIMLQKPKGFWTFEQCFLEAQKYNNKTDFKKKCSSAYNNSKNNGWLGKVCNHMIEGRKPNNFWTKEQCRIEAKKYTKRKEFITNSTTAYNKSWSNNWLDELCSHMDKD